MNTNTESVGISGWLGIVFIVLRLTHTITWPWLWAGTVLAPLALVLAVLCVLALVALLSRA